MTEIFLHGILGKIYGKKFKFKVKDCCSAFKAIDCIKEGFLKKIIDLSKKGYNYQIIIDGNLIEDEDNFFKKEKIKSIHVVPSITGAIFGIESVVINAIIIAFIQALVTAIIQTITALIVASITKNALMPLKTQSYTGGNIASMEAKTKSYIFTNDINTANQGEAIPIGYGRMKIGSQIISVSMKNYLTNVTFFETSEFLNKKLIEI